MAEAKASEGAGDDGHSIADLSRDELEAAYFEMVRYAQQLQGRETQMTSAFRVLRQKYMALKAEVQDLLWNKLRRPECCFDQMPPLSQNVVEDKWRVGRYALGATLGIGSSGLVQECRDEATGEKLALKSINKAKVTRYKTARRLHNEIRLTGVVDSPNVSRFVDAIQTQDKLYLVLEHGGRDLYSYVSNLEDALPEAEARSVCAQIVAGVCALSACDIVHHDIKTENILVEADDDGAIFRLRLTDLGMAESYGRTARATAFCGSPGFFPPEMVTAFDYDPFRVDVWSVGCVALELLLGRKWFNTHWAPSSTLTDAPRNFEAGVVASLDRLGADLAAAGCSETCAEFVRSALALNPNDRPSIEDLAATPWIARSPHLVRISRENSSSTLDLAAEAPSSPVTVAIVTPEIAHATIAPSPPNDGPPEPAARRPIIESTGLVRPRGG